MHTSGPTQQRNKNARTYKLGSCVGIFLIVIASSCTIWLIRALAGNPDIV